MKLHLKSREFRIYYHDVKKPHTAKFTTANSMKMVYSNSYIHQSLKLNYGKKHLNMFYLTYLYPCIQVLQIQYFYLETYCIRRHVRSFPIRPHLLHLPHPISCLHALAHIVSIKVPSTLFLTWHISTYTPTPNSNTTICLKSSDFLGNNHSLLWTLKTLCSNLY